MSDHDHDHHHDHDHSELSETELRVRALETILTEKGYVDPAALDAIVQAYETKIGPHNGAQVVAKAWSDPAFKRALLEDATQGREHARPRQPGRRSPRRASRTRRSATTWSCARCAPVTPGKCSDCRRSGTRPRRTVPAPSRTRAACSPISASSLPKETEIRVWDSTAETRFLVLPMRPEGTDGWSEQQLAGLVTRDSMIGTGFPRTPGPPS